MMNVINPYLQNWRWPAFALMASLAILAAAHGFERFGLMAPCPLCLRQREVYWAVAAMAAGSLVLWKMRHNPRFLFAINIMLGLVFVTGAVVAGFHAGVEYGFWPAPSGCAVVQPVDPMAMDDLLVAIDQPQAVPSCSSDPWNGRYGLSMAGWNMMMQVGLAALSFRAAGVTFDRGPVPALAE
ncbi:MAG: disulfide bond formation protein B [Pseudomonadota bacterium]